MNKEQEQTLPEATVDTTEEYVQEAEEVAALAASQDALVAYVPKSRAPFQLNTLIPRNMAFEVQKSLNRVVKKHGNMDHYVRNALKYPTAEALWKSLAAEQVDAVGLYLAQFAREQGLIIADQTGIGKGRQAAAVIRHAIVNGYLPVFFTRKPDLFSDLYRDLKGIDFSDIKPFIVNTDAQARVKDERGEVVFSPLSAKDQEALLVKKRTVSTDSAESLQWHKSMKTPLPDPEKTPTVDIPEVIDHLPDGYDCVLCTYSQIQAAAFYKRLWLSTVVKAGVEESQRYRKVVFILDESHMAGGYDSIIGQWMRGVLPHTKACCYLSATFAKYPEVMPFYAKKTAISEAAMKDETFVGAMSRGGLALQEIVASSLAESGQLVNRKRSSEGIKVEYITLDQEPARTRNRDQVNRIVKLMNDVVVFEKNHITPELEDLHKQARKSGEHLDKRPKSLGVKSAPFFSRVFNIVDQMLFALKVEEVARFCIHLLNEDKKVVIAFKSTMGAFLKDLSLVSGDVILPAQMDFARTLLKGLNSVFDYNYTDIEGNKSRKRIALEDLSDAARAEYQRIKEEMLATATGLTISPIDQLIRLIEAAVKKKGLGGHGGENFKVAEVTGRNQRIRFDADGQGVIESFRSDTEKFFRLFNDGTYDVLLINQSGSTGSSAHASKDFTDQRQRAMIIHQFELDINTEVQKRGRINRTGQVVLPEYYYITSDIPTEQRLMTMLKGKLKSLDANTTGSQKTSEDTLKSADFFNKYGDKVAWVWVKENPRLAARMGHPTYHMEKDRNGEQHLVRNESSEGAIRQVTGRAGLLRVEDQEQLYEQLLKKYHHQIEWEKQRGTYDLEIEFLKLDAEVKKRYLYMKGKGGSTPFGKDTVRDETIVNNLKRPFTQDQLNDRVSRELAGQKPEAVQKRLSSEAKEAYPAIREQLLTSRQQTIRKLEEELAEIPAPDVGNEGSEERTERQKSRLESLIQEKRVALAMYEKELDDTLNIIIKGIEGFLVGQVVRIPVLGTDTASWGVFLGVRMGKTKNPYTLGNISFLFATADSRTVVEYNLTTYQRTEISRIYAESRDLDENEVLEVQRNWNELIKAFSQARMKRHILTENIVGASGMIGTLNKLVKYNTLDGVIRNGIVLHVDYGREGENEMALLPISDALETLHELAVDAAFSDHQLRVRFKRLNERVFQVFITKSGNFELYTSDELRNLLMKADGQGEDEKAEFVQNAGDMTAPVHMDKLPAFLEQLDKFGIQYAGEARELEDWEVDNEQAWEKETASKDRRYRYQLAKPYGQGSNPAHGFFDYEEPNPKHPFGAVIYNRRLSDAERYNYSLIPVHANVEVPYQEWKNHLQGTELLKEWKQVIRESRDADPLVAIENMGQFIMNNPHEDGNPEFVFGRYTSIDLGRAAYEDETGTFSPLQILIIQLKTALQTL